VADKTDDYITELGQITSFSSAQKIILDSHYMNVSFASSFLANNILHNVENDTPENRALVKKRTHQKEVLRTYQSKHRARGIDIINVLKELCLANPNKFTDHEIKILEATLLFIAGLQFAFSAIKSEKNSDEHTRIQNTKATLLQLERIANSLNDTHICKPVSGLVIHKERVAFKATLEKIQKDWKELN
jgi:hypothetical protein